jgi:type IV pilus assembly protein PilA
MLQRLREKREEGEKGFTLIELLVVILIIAILAAIAIPVFLAQRKKGWNGQVQSALKNAATAAESHATDNNGSYAALNATTESGPVADEGYKGAADVTLAITGDDQSYCIVATHATLTDPDDEWAVASYDSDEGEPKADNAC